MPLNERYPMTTTYKFCPACCTQIPANAPAGICPKCLMAAGLESETQSRAATMESPASSRFQPLEVSELAGKFPQLELIELLGYGGMGAVYKARQPKLDRFVALKVVRSGSPHEASFAGRFSREAKTLARLHHPKIVTIYDFGEVEMQPESGGMGRPLYYFLMEYVEGQNLRQLMQSGELKPEQAMAIVPEICEGLQYAHDQGVIHRDIKPENILVDIHGHVKIADFGLAKLATHPEEDCTLTGPHQVMGTVRYMAPEQIEASGSVDHRADIYSLGVVFYEMLTGEVPAGNFDPPSRKVQLDVRLDEVVLRSLAREPDRRYQHASDIKTDVDHVRAEPADFQNSSKLSAASVVADEVGIRKRAAELAEVEPNWYSVLQLGLYFIGWSFVGAMWNFRWPGIVLAVSVMTAVIWYVIQMKLRYMPRLRTELGLDPRWARYGNLIPGLVMIGLGVLAAIMFHPALADSGFFLSGLSEPNEYLYDFADAQTRNKSVPALAAHVGLKNVEIAPRTFSIDQFQELGFAYATGAALMSFVLLIAGVMSTVDTRRFRYSWRYYFLPAFSVTAFCMLMLLFVHATHMLFVGFVGFGTGAAASQEIRASASLEVIDARISTWMNENGYLESTHASYDLMQDQKPVGRLEGRRYVARSWFDAYRVSWSHIIQRPLPMLSLTLVGNEKDHNVFIQIDLPRAILDSPERELWMKLSRSLETDLTTQENGKSKIDTAIGTSSN